MLPSSLGCDFRFQPIHPRFVEKPCKSSVDPHSLFQRVGRSVSRLEDEMSAGNVNHWRIASWFLLMLLACVIFLSAHGQSEPTARRVEAEEFILKDSSGRVRARLGLKNDQASIEFYDERGSVISTMPSRGLKPVQTY